MSGAPNPLADAGVDRAAHRRRDAAWLDARLRDAETRVVPVLGAQSLVAPGPAPAAVLLPAPAALPLAAPGAVPILLGEAEGRAYFALEVAGDPAPAAEGEWAELRRFGALLGPRDAALLAHARGMVYWHRRHRFCGECGLPTRADEAGHLRVCSDPACDARHFPRTDPAVIVRITCGERLLLARQAQWTPGQFSVIAGFVEPGESLEDAVRREAREETGLALEEVRYHSSQPWPFPSSVMLGFTAVARDPALRLDDEELEDARWLSRAELRGALAAGELRLPSPISISHRLIREWLDDG